MFSVFEKNEKGREGGRCLRGRDKRLGFIKEDKAKIWNEHMEKIVNEENEYDQMVETDIVERLVKNKDSQRNCRSNAKDMVRKKDWTI